VNEPLACTLEPADEGGYPRIQAGRGDPPPLYPPLDEDEPDR